MGDVAAELEDLERRGWEALSSPLGADFYSEVMAEDGLMVFPGMVLNREATLAAMRRERPWSSFRLEEVHVLGSHDSGIVVYRATAQRGGATYRAMMSTVYQRRNGRWHLVLHQQSP